MKRITIINPDSDDTMTDMIDRRLDTIGMPVSAIAQTPDMLARMVECVGRLTQKGASSVKLGCAESALSALICIGQPAP